MTRKISICLYLSLITLSCFAQFDSLQFENRTRVYRTNIPPAYDGTKPVALVLGFHGGVGKAINFKNLYDFDKKSDAEGFIAVYPEGAYDTTKTLKIRTWNGGDCCGYAVNEAVNDVGFVDSLLSILIATYNIDTNRIYATGMSNGAFMSYRLACELPNRFAAIAPVAGSMTVESCNVTTPVSIIHFQSTLDTSIPYQGGIGNGLSDHYNPPLDSVLNVWSSINGCINTPDTLFHDTTYTQLKWSGCRCNSEIEFYLTYDGGHSWPGGKKPLPSSDDPSVYVNATDLMWEFFKSHPKDCMVSAVQTKSPQDIKVYPNPFRSKFIVQNLKQNAETITVKIYDYTGKLLIVDEGRSDELEINTSNLKAGMYLVNISTKSELLITQPIIKFSN